MIPLDCKLLCYVANSRIIGIKLPETRLFLFVSKSSKRDEISIRTMSKQTENDILWIFHLTNKLNINDR